MRVGKKNCAQCFRMLADRTRIAILKRLKAVGVSGMSVSEVVKRVSVSQPTVSHHLRLLSEIGLLTREKKGREIHYAFNNQYPCKGCGVFSAAIKL